MTISKETLEQLSEFVDGQGDRETGLFFAKRLSADSDLQSVWARYHLIRECVRHRGAHGQAIHLQDRVATALSAEPEPNSQPLQMQPAWLRPVAGLAITAVVAVTAVIAVQNNADSPGQIAEVPVVDSTATAFVTPENNGLGPAANRAIPVSYQSGSNNQRLNAYLLRHNQVVARTGRGGVIYLAPIVSAQNSTAAKPAAEKPQPDDEEKSLPEIDIEQNEQPRAQSGK
jgi:sigma-E factor negative regulatory protein RseA